ncbi:diguanylate cyclase [Geobacter metallireducens RCH3]|uniref:diguanylate cyclase n=1 Tax=Geobacter metallireducens (strain ATCC 53774 / DSM 7210 / GS-15) TaxID=269799 RepID=Q39XK9_GEOMG|nr:diguanylate cyclase [Geobacter metallireducens]ABB31015.1 diguanylate cyclase, CAP_ED domain-containing [Geobacter metallireducens GS-15]EHP86021.1 diguanylate cyclase [Geobacter metallireducens RCH3]
MTHDSLFSTAELETVPLFRFVPLECIEGILAHCTAQELPRGERFEPDGPLDRSLSVLLSGRLALHYDVRETNDPLFLEPGDIIGETFSAGEPGVPCLLVAAEPCRVLVMEEDLIWSLAQASHAAACNLLGILLRRRHDPSRESFAGTAREYALHDQSIVDPLTGFQTRRWLEGVLERQAGRAASSGKPLSLMMIDIDHFRAFNEEHGRIGGDRALHAVSKALRNYLRPTEVVARYGGDTFAILLPETGVATARMIAERLRQRLTNTVIDIHDGRMLPPLTISVGVAEAAVGSDSLTLLRGALEALDAAKASGGNAVSG